MSKFRKYQHLGVYGIIIKNNKILLIKKYGGPYDSKLDFPGGTIEFGERPTDALARELKEEVGITIDKLNLLDTDSVFFDWNYHDQVIKVFHVGIFYNILKYHGKIKESIKITNQNDDSLGAKFYEIDKLKKDNLSRIVILELEKLGYNIN